MKAIEGPGVFLTQLINHQAHFDSLSSVAEWAANLGFKAMQIPCSCDPEFFNLARASESQNYCDEVQGVLASKGVEISELSTYFEGQLIAVPDPAAQLCDAFAPAAVRGDDTARRAWAY